ncbi:hypothetical protein ACFV9C_07465 [Kribbella sp. NPDC059898]|uniref:hypothetical protein n=1 Tax=Kribbella sp. NPDC059898 TaxID=3346995 RepID=UPI003656BF47
MKLAAAAAAALLLVGLLPAAPAVAVASPGLLDSFDGARDASPTYGLNDSLGTRQSGAGKGVTFTRVHGNWTSPASTPPSYYSQVGNNSYPGRLSFWIGNSAVRLDAPAAADATDAFTVSATVDPNANSAGPDTDWSSLMLSGTSTSTGYVTASDIAIGLTVRRTGEVMLYRNGVAQWPTSLTTTRQSTGFGVAVTVTGASTAAPAVSVTVNGATKTAALVAPLPRAYVYLGAYLTSGSSTPPYGEVSAVDNLQISKITQYADSFDGAADTDPGYGLNDNLAGRQTPQTNAGYTRVSGNWSSTAPPPSNYSQVNNNAYPGKLSFWVAPSAVKTNVPAIPDGDDAIDLAATVDPDPGLFGTPGDWVSLMLSSSSTSTGYVTDAANRLGMTIARNGVVTFYKDGAVFGPTLTATRSAAGYAVTVRITAASTANPTVTVTVNGAQTSFALGASVGKSYVYLGAYLSNGSATAPYKEVSTVDDLTVGKVSPFPFLKYYGTYGTRNDDAAGNHVPDMAGIANLHWINVSPTDPAQPVTYRTDVFASCPPHSCIVYVGSEFFDPGSHAMYPDRSRWNSYVAMLQPYKDKIFGYYLQDEPYIYGITGAQMDVHANAVKASITAGSIPAGPILMTDTLYDINTWAHVPAAVDWLGMDAYSMDAATIEAAATRLDEMTLDPTDRTYMFPPNVPDTWNGFTTEQQVIGKQYEYLATANRHPKLTALLNFGLWVNTGAGGSHVQTQENVPNLFAIQERVGNAVMNLR